VIVRPIEQMLHEPGARAGDLGGKANTEACDKTVEV